MKKSLLALGATLAFVSGVAVAKPGPENMPPSPHGEHAGPKGPRELPKEITREQFLAEAAERFAAMDTNKDGKLERAEMRAFHDKLRAKRGERREDRRDER